MNSLKKVVSVVSLVFVVSGLLIPSVAHAQSSPTREDGMPIIDFCKALWDRGLSAYMIICPVIMAMPLIVHPFIEDEPDSPPEPPSTPEPPTKWAVPDNAGDDIQVETICNVNSCDSFGEIIFNEASPRMCPALVGIELFYRSDEERMMLKQPYIIFVRPDTEADSHLVKIRRFTNDDGWERPEFYGLTLICEN